VIDSDSSDDGVVEELIALRKNRWWNDFWFLLLWKPHFTPFNHNHTSSMNLRVSVVVALAFLLFSFAHSANLVVDPSGAILFSSLPSLLLCSARSLSSLLLSPLF
jgi:hypothetical protein